MKVARVMLFVLPTVVCTVSVGYAFRVRNQPLIAFTRMMDSVHAMKGPAIAPGSTVMLGDSITQAMNPVDAGVVEVGVAGATSTDLLKRIPTYSWLKDAGVVVVAIGINDLIKHKGAPTAANMKRNYREYCGGNSHGSFEHLAGERNSAQFVRPECASAGA